MAGKLFNEKDYQYRMRLLREIISGRSQQAFANELGIPMKTWNNYERGYPVPRETAFLLMEKYHESHGISIDWLWFGIDRGLSPDFKRKVRQADALREERKKAHEELAKARQRKKELDDAFASKMHPDRR